MSRPEDQRPERPPRVVVTFISPSVDGDRRAVKRTSDPRARASGARFDYHR
jgi:hypothetical protein